MLVSDVLTAARYRLNDTNSVVYSDNELIEYLNTGQRFINKFLVERNSSYIKATTTLTMVSDKATLPSDFFALWYVKDDSARLVKYKDPTIDDNWWDNYYFPDYSVVNQTDYYYTIGNEIYSNLDTLEVGYYTELVDNTSTSDTIPLPDSFKNILIEMVLAIAFNSEEYSINVEEQFLKQFSKALNMLIIARDFPVKENVRRVMPFKV